MLGSLARLWGKLSETRSLLRKIATLDGSLAQHRKHVEVQTFMDWIEHATVRTAPLISVVLPTRDRRELLSRAVGSVDRQTYQNWELLIVDDSSIDDTPGYVASLTDSRVRGLSGYGSGVCAARNIALARARGELIAYLDDDNIMHPNWLKSVAWGFEQRPEASILWRLRGRRFRAN